MITSAGANRQAEQGPVSHGGWQQLHLPHGVCFIPFFQLASAFYSLVSSQSRPSRGWKSALGPWKPEAVSQAQAEYDCMPEIPALRRQEDCCQFKASLGYVTIPLSHKNKCC